MSKQNLSLAAALLALLVLLAALALLLPAQTLPETLQGIQITEICTKNETVIADNNGKYRDYIELYNAGEAVDLTGFTLTDGKGHSAPLGSLRLAQGEYRVLFLTEFSLGASGGDVLQLLDPQGTVAAQVQTAPLAQDEVMLLIDGSYQVSANASPGFSNDEAGLAAFREGIQDGSPKLVISELLISNEAALPDENGAYSDAVELFNASDEALELGRFFLSDRKEARFAWRLPDITLQPGEYIVFFCDGANTGLHTNFGLSFGETLYLTDSQGRHTSLAFSHPGADVSLALVDGAYTPAAVSLGYPNTQEGIAAFLEARLNEDSPLVIQQILLTCSGVPYQGRLQDVIEIVNRSDEAVSTAGWFLSDGGDPYRYPLPEQTLAPGQVLTIPCGPETTGFSLSEGETVRLTGPDFRYALPVTCTDCNPGESICLLGEGYTFAPAQSTNQPGALIISEVMSTNTKYLMGIYGATCDWIELYNSGESDIILSDYALSDDSGQLGKYPLPGQVLAPGEYCVLFLTESTERLRVGYEKLPMTLSPDGETLYLSKGDVISDYLFLPALEVDTAYGRAEGTNAFTTLSKPTPGKANTGEAQVTAAPVAVTPQGSYDDVEYIDVVLEGEGEIYYTTNCRVPTTASTRYTEPIRLKKTTVLRVMCQAEGKQASQVIDLTYLINENDTLPAVCIVSLPENFWSQDRGIYVKGPETGSVFPYTDANFWKDWEYAASVALFETDGTVQFAEPCGVKIFGAYSRALIKKSLAIMFRSEYGTSSLEYPLFGEESLDHYEAFVLRSSGQDAFYARMRDVMITSLAHEYTGIPVQKYKPVVVYLNGSYYGLHYIREKINEHYIAGNFNTDPEDANLEVWNGWDDPDYREVLQYAMDHDMSQQEHYDYIASRVDLDNYTDYLIAQIWIANKDIGNHKFFKTSEMRWTWILFDTDLSFRHPDHNSIENHLNKAGIGPWDSVGKTLAICLFENEAFLDKFLTRFAWQINTVWTEENVIGRIDALEALIHDDMVKDLKRWGNDYNVWQKNVEELRRFARRRNGYLLGYIQDYFDLSDQEMKDYGFPVQ